MLSARGEVETSGDVTGEARQIDMFFVPFAEPPENATPLGLLEKMTARACVFEPFRICFYFFASVGKKTPTRTPREIRSCMGKLFYVCGEKEREARGEKRKIKEKELPIFCLLTPTISQTILSGVNAVSDGDNWRSGVYSLREVLKTKIVAIYQLLRTLETLWLQILGKGRVRKEAIAQLKELSSEDPINFSVLELIYNLLTRVEVSDSRLNCF